MLSKNGELRERAMIKKCGTLITVLPIRWFNYYSAEELHLFFTGSQDHNPAMVVTLQLGYGSA